MELEHGGEYIGREQGERDVKLALRRLAMYHLAMVDVLRQKLGDQAGSALAAEVADRYGEMVGRGVLEKNRGQGRGNSLAEYREDLPGLGFSSQRISEDPLRVRIHHCPLALAFAELGRPRDGAIYCRVDQAKYRAYNPDLVCVHERHAPTQGGDYCQLLVREKETD